MQGAFVPSRSGPRSAPLTFSILRRAPFRHRSTPSPLTFSHRSTIRVGRPQRVPPFRNQSELLTTVVVSKRAQKVSPQNAAKLLLLRGKISGWRGLNPLESASHFEVRRVQIPSGTPNLINALHGNPICIAIHRKYTLFRPDHTYNFALRRPLVGPESLGVGSPIFAFFCCRTHRSTSP